jgi:hypothetical protein
VWTDFLDRHQVDGVMSGRYTVPLPDDPDLSPERLETLLAHSQAGEPKEFRVSVEAVNDLMDGGLP